MTKKVCIYVNGIMTMPGDAKNWNRRAVTHTHLHTNARAESLEYLVGPLSRVLGQKKRANKLLKKIRWYSGWEIVLVGHSNGADVICDALRQINDSGVKEVHLFAPACEADFQKNGLNEAGLEKVRVYIGEKDKALKWASLKPARWLGYGTLGKTGPINVREDLDVKTITRNFSHSEWWEKDEFNATMYELLGK